MSINYRTLRNAMRGFLITGCSIPSSLFAWEGRDFNGGDLTVFIQEVTGIDGEVKPYCGGEGLQITFTYNVRANLGYESNIIETMEDYRDTISDYFSSKTPFVVGALKVQIIEVTRRVATNKDGWRLAPIDIVVKVSE